MHEHPDHGHGAGDGAGDTQADAARADYPWADDYLWVQAEREKPNQGVFGLYEGLWVAVYNRQAVGAAGGGNESAPLVQRVAAHYGIDPDRVMLVGVEGPEDFFTRAVRS
jgi:hypothetical protein